MVHITSTIVALKTITLVLGGLITYFATRAYRRTAASALRALAIGFGLVTLGGLFGGIVDRLLTVAPKYALIIESVLTAAGFTVILYSLYVDE